LEPWRNDRALSDHRRRSPIASGAFQKRARPSGRYIWLRPRAASASELVASVQLGVGRCAAARRTPWSHGSSCKHCHLHGSLAVAPAGSSRQRVDVASHTPLFRRAFVARKALLRISAERSAEIVGAPRRRFNISRSVVRVAHTVQRCFLFCGIQSQLPTRRERDSCATSISTVFSHGWVLAATRDPDKGDHPKGIRSRDSSRCPS
jgi:hypothetical protein